MDIEYLKVLKKENDDYLHRSRGMTVCKYQNFGYFNLVLIPIKSKRTFYPALDLKSIKRKEDLFEVELALKELYALRVKYKWLDSVKLGIDDFIAYNIEVLKSELPHNLSQL